MKLYFPLIDLATLTRVCLETLENIFLYMKLYFPLLDLATKIRVWLETLEKSSRFAQNKVHID